MGTLDEQIPLELGDRSEDFGEARALGGWNAAGDRFGYRVAWLDGKAPGASFEELVIGRLVGGGNAGVKERAGHDLLGK
jgi:hypothetical protein